MMWFENLLSFGGLYAGLCGGVSVLALVVYVGYEIYLRCLRGRKVCEVL